MNAQARTLETDRLPQQNPIQKLKEETDSVSFTIPPKSLVMFLFTTLFCKGKEKRLKKQETGPKRHIEKSYFLQVTLFYYSEYSNLKCL